MRSTIDELRRDLSDLRLLVESIGPATTALARHSDSSVKQYLLIRRRFDYAAFVVGLYAAFEGFAEDLAASYASSIARHCSYGELPEKLRKAHLRKSAEVLARDRFGKGQFSDNSELGIVRNLFDCLKNDRPYALNHEVLASHDGNLRFERLSELFTLVGIERIGDRVAEGQAFRAWFGRSQGRELRPEEKVPKEFFPEKLGDVVERRNRVAHGGLVDERQGPREMGETLEFIQVLCETLYDCAVSDYLRTSYVVKPTAVPLTRVDGPLKGKKVVIVRKPSALLRNGQCAFVLVEGGHARRGRIKNLQLDGANVMSVSGDGPDTDIGVELDFDCSKMKGLYILPEEDDLVWSPLLSA